MTVGLGTDIIEVSRIRKSIERYGQKFLNRIFTQKEQEYCSKYKRSASRHYAGRFAAKEAIFKALGTGLRKGISWKDVEIRNDTLGKPFVTLSPKLKEKFPNHTVILSISHCHEYATATALLTTS